MTDKDAPQRIVALALERFGRIDFLINNAGVGSPKPLDETDDEMLDCFLDIMLRAPFRLCREVIPHLGRRVGVVNVTSTFAHDRRAARRRLFGGQGRAQVADRAHGLRIRAARHPLELRRAGRDA